MESKERLHAYIKGKVQGVFFRDWTARQAHALGLTGWVKNIKDGRVEIVAEGKRGNLQKLIELAKKGPPQAEVDHIDLIWEEATHEFNNFETVR